VQLLDGIASELFKFHYRLTILPEVPHHQVSAVLNNGTLDGVIWCKLPADPELLTELADCPLPIIALNAPPAREAAICFFSCDNEGGMRLAVDHLADLGHPRIDLKPRRTGALLPTGSTAKTGSSLGTPADSPTRFLPPVSHWRR
jgi:DNA-binding LacI/PurR family transcriptional regulator